MAKEFYETRVGGVVLVVVGFFLMVGFGLSTVEDMPDNAWVLVDPSTSTYIAPPCLDYRPYRGHRLLMPIKDARARGYTSEPNCREEAGFFGAAQGLIGAVLWPKDSRWNPDGSWRY